MRSLIAFLLCFRILVISANPDYRVIRQASQSPSTGDRPINPRELFKAVGKNDVERVGMLIDRGVDVNSKNKHGETPLHNAASKGRNEIVKILIDRGANVNSIDGSEETPLHRAAFHGQNETVKILIDRGANVNSVGNFKQTPLSNAASLGHAETVKILIDRGADVNAQDYEGSTALHSVAVAGRNEIVEMLIDRGANVNAVDNRGISSLYHAASRGQSETVKILIEHGAIVYIKTIIGGTPPHSEVKWDEWTPLHVAAFNGHGKTVNILIDGGAYVNARDYKGATPLYYAAINGKSETVKILSERGADINSKTRDGQTPLHYVAKRGSIEVLKVLVDLGANVNVRDDKGDSPLHNAAYFGGDEKLKILIEGGADVNLKNNDGWTPLHAAANADGLEKVQLLLAKGADVNARTKDGKTAAELSRRGGQVEQLLTKNRPAKLACETYMQLSEDNILGIGSTQVSSEKEFPWMAALGYVQHINSKYTVVFECGGTIISEYFIMTAVHCVLQNYLPSVVRLGKISLRDDDDKQAENPKIKEFFRHPEYSEETKKNDIALIQLVISIFFRSSIAPACLQLDVRDESADVKLFATGWGITDKKNRTSTSNVLRKTQLMTMPLAECNAKLLDFNRGKNDEALKDGLGEGQYCTFHPRGHDSCSGDSGGPIQYFNNSRFATVVGVISFGVGGCGSGLPSVNTRVAHYLYWIESVVWPNGFTLN